MRVLIDSSSFLVKALLAKFGYEVELASDGKELITLFKNAMITGQPFDGVIMASTVHGGMGGKEAIRKLKQIDPGINALVSSGYSTDPIMADYKKYGFCGVLVKPFQLGELKKAIRQLFVQKP